MTLLITVFAAIVSTVIWYQHADEDNMKIGTLSLMYWGASLMWLVDAVVEYVELKEDYFAPAVEEMINDAFLGASVVAFGLVIWLVIVLVRDPKGKMKAALFHEKVSR